MSATQTIAIVEASGKMGRAIARSIAGSNCRLLLMGMHEESLSRLKAEIEILSPVMEVDVITCAKDACWEADVIILAVDYENEKEVAKKIKEVATGKIVIRVSRAINSVSDGLLSEQGSHMEELYDLLPHSKILNTSSTHFEAVFYEVLNVGDDRKNS